MTVLGLIVGHADQLSQYFIIFESMSFGLARFAAIVWSASDGFDIWQCIILSQLAQVKEYQSSGTINEAWL